MCSMSFLKAGYSFNRWRFEGMFLAFGVLWGLMFFAAAVLYLAFPTPWAAFAAFGFVVLILALGLAASLEKRHYLP